MNKRPFDWSKVPNIEVRGLRKTISARLQIHGKEVWRSLHIEADEFGENAPFVKESMRALRLKLAQDSFAILKLTHSRNGGEFSTCGELFAAYAKVCAGRDILDATVKTTVSRFRYICAKVHGEFFDVDNARTSIVNRDLAAQFEHRVIAGIKALAAHDAAINLPWSAEKLEQRLQSAKNSAKSTLQQARSLFAAAVLDSVYYREIVLPPLTEFMKYRIGGSTISPFVPPPADVWKRIVEDLPALKTQNVAQWLAFQLGVNCGLRRSSARNARWAWCVENADGSAEMRIGRAKGNNSTVTIAPMVWAEIKGEWAKARAAGAEPNFILPGDNEIGKGSRDEIVAEVVEWLRARGLTVEVSRCPFHLLRKMFGDHMRSTHSLDEAQKALGHSSNKLTHAVYSDHRSTKYVQVV